MAFGQVVGDIAGTTKPVTPCAAARASTSSRSASNAGESRWQCESITCVRWQTSPWLAIEIASLVGWGPRVLCKEPSRRPGFALRYLPMASPTQRVVAHWRVVTGSPWVRAARGALLGDTPVLAGGAALFAIFAAVPTLAAVVTLYGLIADPHQISSHLAGLERVLPRAVVDFLAAQLALAADKSSGTLGITFAASVVLALFSARGAVAALMTVLNSAYRVRDRRSGLHRFVITLVFATTTLVGSMVFAIVVVGLPAVVAIFPVHRDVGGIATALRWPALFIAVLIGQALLFRLVPAPRKGAAHVVWPGAIWGTLLWLATSWGLSFWVEHVANYHVLYGSFATVVVVLLWFYLSVLAIMFGGFVNAELERSKGNAPPSESFYGQL